MYLLLHKDLAYAHHSRVRCLLSKPAKSGSGECEDFTVPETLKFQGDLLLDDINKMKARLGEGTLADSILKAIKKVEEKIGNAEITRGHLKRQKISKSKKLDPENIIETKRQRKTVKEILG